ncbi:hypothetical protein Ancab_038149 [Ancistrocladus abbreviatus]
MIAFAYGKVSNLEWKPSTKKEKEAAIVERGHLVSARWSAIASYSIFIEENAREKSASEREMHQRERAAREARLQKAEANVVEARQKEVEANEVHLKESTGRGASA